MKRLGFSNVDEASDGLMALAKIREKRYALDTSLPQKRTPSRNRKNGMLLRLSELQLPQRKRLTKWRGTQT